MKLAVLRRGAGGFGVVAIVAEAVSDDQGDGRFSGLVIEAAGLEAVLAVAIIATGHWPFSPTTTIARREVVSLGGGGWKSANGKAIVKAASSAGGTINFPVRGPLRRCGARW